MTLKICATAKNHWRTLAQNGCATEHLPLKGESTGAKCATVLCAVAQGQNVLSTSRVRLQAATGRKINRKDRT